MSAARFAAVAGALPDAARPITVAVAGNPNSGKSTLINAIAGSRLQVGNWPGVTVEKKEASFEHGGRRIRLVDLPGTYSLSPYSQEEIVAVSVADRGGCASRAEDMGLRVGKRVVMLSNGAGPVLVKVDESRIAVDRGVAMSIQVRLS